MSYEIAIIVAILGIIGLFAYLSVKLEDNYAAVKTFFLLLSLLFVLIGFIFLKGIAQDNYSSGIVGLLDSTYAAYSYVFIFLVFFFVINLLLQIMSTKFSAKRQNEEG